MLATNVSEEKIVWSGKDFKLSEFVEICPPPQIVKVEEGYMDDKEEDRCLSSSQVLTLHMVKEVITIQAISNQNHAISLPTNSTANIEIICEPSYYQNVAELALDLPPFVASFEKHPWLGLNVNDILEVKSVSKSLKSSHLVCINRTSGADIELPLNYTARFKALGHCPVVNPTMNDITKHCKFPVVVRYVDDKLKVVHEGFNADFPFGLDKLGPLILKSVAVNRVLFTTPWGYDKVMPVPLNLQVRVVAAVGALQNDRKYSSLCEIAHNNARPDDLDLKFIKEGRYKVLLEEKQCQSDDEDDEDYEAYCEVGPQVPSRDLKPNRHRSEGSPDHKSITTRLTRSTSVNMPFDEGMGCFSRPEDVFGKNLVDAKGHKKTKLTSVKKVFSDIKRVSKHDFNKVFKKPENPKAVEERYEHNVETTLELSHATRHVKISHANTSHASPQQINEDPGYREVQRLPWNLPADRFNPDFVKLPVKSKISGKEVEKSSSSKCNIRLPAEIRTWTVKDVSECLRYCHLEEYVDRFKQEMIDGGLLADLDEDSFRSLGVNNKLHLLKMMKIIKEGWLPK